MRGPSATEIARRIEARIGDGALRAGDRLPSVRDHAIELHVSPTTVAAAYRRLRERGLVLGRGRQGTLVAPRPPTEAGRGPEIPDTIVDAMSGNPDPAALPPIETALQGLRTAAPARYGDPLVHPGLAATAVEILTTDGVDAEYFTVTSGSMHAIELIIATEQFRLGDRLAVEDPGHIPVHQIGRRAGMELVPVTIDEEGMTPRSLDIALRSGVSAVVLTPRVQNPTGAALSAERATALSSVLADHPEVVLIVDDHAGPVSSVESFAVAPPGPRWASIRSLGKSHGPDLRLALVAGDRTTIDRIEVAVSTGAGWVSHILQRVAAHLLTDDTTRQLVQDAASRYEGSRRRMIDVLARDGVEATGRSGLNVWIPVHDEQAAIEAARGAGYAIRGGDPYRISSPAAVRVTITMLTDPQVDELAAALVDHLTGAAATPRV